MREEIEAAALFITRLVNKNLSNVCSTTSSIHSHSSSASSSLSSSSSTSSDGAPDFDDQNHQTGTATAAGTTAATSTTTTNGGDHDKVEQFKQCLQEALFERFHNHWFPEQPTKGQAYRCIRLNEWDRRDITLQKVCTQCGIDYKDLQLPVELTLWVDPDEVTCRFGENKGSHCLVAKFKEGELKDNNIDLDINNIDIEFFRQTTVDGIALEQGSMHASPDYNNQHNRSNNNVNGSSSNNNNNNNNTSYQFHNQNNSSLHQQQQQNHQTQLRHQQQSSPHHFHHQSPHRASMGKAAIYPSYHHGYSNGCDSNGNPIPYYFF